MFGAFAPLFLEEEYTSINRPIDGEFIFKSLASGILIKYLGKSSDPSQIYRWIIMDLS